MVLDSSRPSIYTIAWYLDAAYPNWEAYIWEKEDRYEAAVPFPRKRVGPLSWVQIPYFVQQTGLVYRKGLFPEPYLKEFFTQKLSFGIIALQIAFSSALNDLVKKHAPAKWKSTRKKNFLLDLEQSVDILISNFNENRKRNLKKAVKNGWICEESTEIEEALKMYHDFQLPNQKNASKKAVTAVRHIYAAALRRGWAELYCVRNENTVLAYALFIRFESRIYYLFGSMSEEGKAHSAISISFAHVIKKYAGQALTLDFEGGNMPNIGQYFASFGASPEEYLSLSYHLLKA